MPFDVQGARDAGYSEKEIADYLASQRKFDVAGARKANYSDAEIIAHLEKTPAAAAPRQAPPPAAAPAVPKKSVLDGAPTAPLAGAGRADLGGRILQIGDQLGRTYGGAAADLADAAAGLINRPINSVLRATGVDYQLPTDQFGPRVAQPVGALPQVSRALAPFLFGAGGTARALEAATPRAVEALTGAQRGRVAAQEAAAALKAAPRVATPIATGVAAGAPVDAAMSSKSDKNLSNLVQDMGGPQLPTARVAGESPGIAAVKDMAEGAVLGATVEKVLGFFTHGPRFRPGTPEAAAEADEVTQAMLDPRIKAQLDASGVAETSPRYQDFAARVQERQAAEAAARNPQPILAQAAAEGQALTPETAQQLDTLRGAPNLPPTTRQDLEAAILNDIDPSRIRAPEPAQPPPVIVVDSAGRADTGDLGTRTGADLRKPSNLPVPVETPTPRMSDAEIAQAQRSAEAGKANPIPEGEPLRAPEGRAPQTREDVAGQRQAGEAFTLADEQRQRVAPEVRDTQTAGLPEGPKPQKVLMDDDFPVKVVEDQGRGRVKVQRYDPRTGEVDPDAVPYDTHLNALSQRDYTAEPRRAQDFAARDNPARMSPELPRQPAEDVAREPTQTYRATPDVPPESAPKVEAEVRPGGSIGGRAPVEGPALSQGRPEAENLSDTAPAAKSAAGTPATAEPVARLRGDEIAPHDADLKTVRTSAKAYFEQNLRGKTVHSEALDKDVKFLNPRKSLSTSAKPEKLRLFAALPEMIEKGRLLGSRPAVGKWAERGAKEFHYLEADVGLGGQAHKVTITLREDANGHIYYNHGLEDELGAAPEPPTDARSALDVGAGTPGAASSDTPALNNVEAAPKAEARPKAEPKENIAPSAPSAKSEPTDAEISDLYKKHFGPGRKLYSNPADPEAIKELLVDPAVRTIKKEIDGFKHDLEQVKADLKGVASNFDGGRALDGAARTVRKVWWSNVAAIRATAEKYKDVPEVRQLADWIGTDPGRGRVVEQVYERAVQMRSLGMANRLHNIVGEKVKPELEEKVADILAGRRRAVGGTAEEEMARKLRKLLDEQHDYMKDAGLDVGYVKGRYYPRVIDEQAVLKDVAGFKAKATDVYRRMGLSSAEAADAAEDWYSRILGVSDGAYSSGLASARSTKGRTLPADADKILADFYVKDPRANLTGYFRQTSRAAEFARRFGANGEKVDELFNAMLKKGVDPKDIENLRHHFESSTGQLYATRPDAGAAALSWIQTAGVLRLLPRAVISSAVEGLSAGVRAHDVGAGFKAMADSYATLFKLRDPDDMTKAAEMLGIVGDAVNNMVIGAQFGGEIGGLAQKKLLARFFRVTHLEQITEAQRLAAARVGQGMIRTLLQDLEGTKRAASAKRLLAELGMDDDGAKAVSAWLGKNKGMPPLEELTGTGREAKLYRTALQRFVDESIQNPTAADKPQWASHAFGRLAYGITSFMFSFTRNVLVRTARETGEGVFGKGYTLEDRARLLTPAIALAVLTAAQAQTSELRDMLLNPQAQAEKSPQQKLVTNLSRAGAFGNADPFINIAMSARYNRDLTSTMTGPYLTAYLDSISKLTVGLIPKSWGGPNSPNTNNAEWQASKAAYEMVASPLIAAAASYAPGGPLLRLGYGAGLISATSPGASRAFADSVAGEREVKPRAQDVGSSDADVDASSDKSDDEGSEGEN